MNGQNSDLVAQSDLYRSLSAVANIMNEPKSDQFWACDNCKAIFQACYLIKYHQALTNHMGILAFSVND